MQITACGSMCIMSGARLQASFGECTDPCSTAGAWTIQ